MIVEFVNSSHMEKKTRQDFEKKYYPQGGDFCSNRRLGLDGLFSEYIFVY